MKLRILAPFDFSGEIAHLRPLGDQIEPRRRVVTTPRTRTTVDGHDDEFLRDLARWLAGVAENGVRP